MIMCFSVERGISEEFILCHIAVTQTTNLFLSVQI